MPQHELAVQNEEPRPFIDLPFYLVELPFACLDCLGASGQAAMIRVVEPFLPDCDIGVLHLSYVAVTSESDATLYSCGILFKFELAVSV